MEITAAQLRARLGAQPRDQHGTHFRVWAPRRRTLEVVLEGAGRKEAHSLESEDGYFVGVVPGAGAGSRYRFRLDGELLVPDPASRWQPEGPHGPSEVVDPSAFPWTDDAWPGIRLDGQVMYELHVGTFTREGTWDAAAEQLDELAAIGVSCIEVMPLAEFPGKFGWGYDGVLLYAPYHGYGAPDDFRRFVDRAHALGIGMILDVVYNHLGPDGNILPQLSHEYFSRTHTTDWGQALNFDGPESGHVREFVLQNVEYWIEDFHLDGFRLDATQDIHDDSEQHIIAVIADRARAAAGGRDILLIAENEPQDTRLVRQPTENGFGLDAIWNDDFHHTAIVALTGRRQAYYSDYGGAPAEFVAAARHGYLYQGQRYAWQGRRRGTPTIGLRPAVFVNYLENHDQVANSDLGLRLHQLSSPGQLRALTALLLLGPETPLLFQGQEFGSTQPFLYFADHRPELAQSVRRGRAEFLSQFPNLGVPKVQENLPAPEDPTTFERCKLDPAERERHGTVRALHRDLIILRRTDPVLRRQGDDGIDGAVLGPSAFLLRFLGRAAGDRLLVVNLGADEELLPAPEPLLAPPLGRAWRTVWSSEHPDYGGRGCPPVEVEGAWRLPGHAAVLLAADVADARQTPADPSAAKGGA